MVFIHGAWWRQSRCQTALAIKTKKRTGPLLWNWGALFLVDFLPKRELELAVSTVFLGPFHDIRF